MYIVIKNSTFKIEIKNSSKPIELNIKELKRDSLTLFETIKIENAKVYNLEFHQARVDFVYKNLFNKDSSPLLKDILKELPKKGLYRAKIIYNKGGIQEVSYYKYKKKAIENLALVELKIDYRYKFINREVFEKLYKIVPNFDEFIITKGGYLTDTTIANIALYHSKTKKWHTPAFPLLEGTTLKRYLQEKKLIKKMIHYTQLNEYAKLATLNAMVDFNILKA